MPRYSTAGITLGRGTVSGTYVTIANVSSISISGAAKEQIEATALNDTAKQFVDSLPGFGQVQFSVYWDPADAGHQSLAADFAATNTPRFWQITHPSSGTIGNMSFTGPVVGFSKTAGPNAVDVHEFTIQISGALDISTT
jgi:hypothetical protein